MIIVDERGGSSGKIGALRRLKDVRDAGLDADLGFLEFGDYGFVGNGPDGDVMVGVELKTISDLLTSLRSERLPKHQIVGMLHEYGYQWLLVEGMWRRGDRGQLEYYNGGHWHSYNHGSARKDLKHDDFEAWLIGLVQPPRLGFWHTRTHAETAGWLKLLHDWWMKPWDAHTIYQGVYLPPPDRVSFEPPSSFVRMVSTIEKVGWTRAAAIEAYLLAAGSTEDDGAKAEMLIAMTLKQLTHIDGIGKGIAENIWRTFHRG